MSLNAPYEDTNIFAKIIAGDMPCVKVFEDTATLAFMDIFPQTEGHCLVIPKSLGATNLLTAPPDMLSTLMASTQKVAKAVSDALNPDGIRIAQFNGAPAGQTVFHLHFHILPVFTGKEFRPHADGGPVAADVLEPLAEAIRAKLKD